MIVYLTCKYVETEYTVSVKSDAVGLSFSKDAYISVVTEFSLRFGQQITFQQTLVNNRLNIGTNVTNRRSRNARTAYSSKLMVTITEITTWK